MKKIFFVLLVIIIIVVFLGVLLWFTAVVPCTQDARCRLNLAYINRNLGDSFIKEMNEIELFQDNLNVTENFDKKRLICPVCKKAYVYSPVAPSGKRIEFRPSHSSQDYWHLIMWCPEPCHKKRRSYLMSDFAVFSFSDDQVSWYYQKIIDCLTDEEFEKENEYRHLKGMKLLNKEKLNMPEIYFPNDVVNP
jgi:hypothetical protein